MALSNRFFGGPRNFVQDPRPPQKPPKSDTSVLVHDCFDQFGGETRPEDCGCTDRISRLEADALIRKNCADALVLGRYGRAAIVLRRDYVEKRILKLKINSRKLLPAILKQGNVLSFKGNVIRAKTGTPITLEMHRTDAQYWNTVLVHVGLGVHASRFLKDAEWEMGVPASFTTLENFHMAPVTTTRGVNPAIEKVMNEILDERKEGVRRGRHKVGAAGFRKGAGGLAYNEWGEIKGAPSIYSPGNARDSDERSGEVHAATGQINSNPDRHDKHDALNSDRDTRTLPELLEDPETLTAAELAAVEPGGVPEGTIRRTKKRTGVSGKRSTQVL
jgi:hypothetical protein